MARRPKAAPAATLVIFGALGDLTRRLLVPALANLRRQKYVGNDLAILGVSHHDQSDEALRAALDEFVVEGDDDGWGKLRRHVSYLRGDFTDPATYAALAERLTGNAVFYLATAPSFFGPVVEKLAAAGLLDEDKAKGFRRVAIEKPFGTDLASAQALNACIRSVAKEEQIYRMDHFLGKETVQNILVARFANPLLEAVWNSRYVDHVQITAAETVGVGTRGKFYDATGALRDMIPNHLFQLLAMVGMEPPGVGPEAIRDEKAKVLQAIRRMTPAEVKADAVRGRYAAGDVAGKKQIAYTREADVAADSRTETYAALKLWVDSWRWAGVPFYLRTGKALTVRDTEIVIQFKPVPYALFRDVEQDQLPPNRLTIQIQPEEAITLDFLAKQPGPEMRTAPVQMAFRYADHWTLGKVTGYETLLYDILTGDQTLFQRADGIEAGWAAVQPILDAWARGKPETYKAGTTGPAGADALMARDGRAWGPIS